MEASEEALSRGESLEASEEALSRVTGSKEAPALGDCKWGGAGGSVHAASEGLGLLGIDGPALRAGDR